MSFITWHNYGYGIEIGKMKIESAERIAKLLEHAPILKKKIEEWLSECGIENPTVDDYLDFDQDYCLGSASLLRDIIYEAEGIEFLACDDFEGMRYLIYPPSYPWSLSEKEKKITENDVMRILCKYVSIVTDDPLVVDFQEAENGGC